MKKLKIAFDVDDTLITKSHIGVDIPKLHTVVVMGMLMDMIEDLEVYVWSGSGVEYAQRWAEKLGIDHEVTVVAKGSIEVDIAFDDQEVTLGTVNVKVK